MKYFKSVIENIMIIPVFIFFGILFLINELVYLFNKKGFLDFEKFSKCDDYYECYEL